MNGLHPSVKILKHKLKRGQHTYAHVSKGTGITEQRLKNMMTGRSEMTLTDRDRICSFLDMSPVNLVLSRKDLNNQKDYLDITMLPEGLKSGLYSLYVELVKLGRDA